MTLDPAAMNQQPNILSGLHVVEVATYLSRRPRHW